MPESGEGLNITQQDIQAKGEKTEVIKENKLAMLAKRAAKFARKHKIESVPVENEKGKANKADIEHFNAGLGLRTKTKEEQKAAREAGLPSINDLDKPITPEMTNSIDVHPVEKFSENTQKRRERINDKLEHDTGEHPLGPKEREQLEKLRDALEDIQPNQFPSFRTENGDFIRPVPETQQYPKAGTLDDQSGEYELADANKEQVLRFVVRNWDEAKIRNGEAVTVSLPTYNTRVDNGSSAQARDDRQGLQHPESPRISINYPGMGSDKLTPEQIQQLLGNEGFSGVADKMIELLESLGVKSINIEGASMGGYTALFLAARAVESDTIQVNKVQVAATPIGSDIMSPNELRKAEGADGKRLPAAMAGIFNPFAFRSIDLQRNWLMRKVGLAKWIGRAAVADPILKGGPYTKSMAHYSPKDLISTILEKQNTTSVHVAVGTEDKVGPAKAWYTLMDEIHKEKPDIDKNRSTLAVLPGASHVFYEEPERNEVIMR